MTITKAFILVAPRNACPDLTFCCAMDFAVHRVRPRYWGLVAASLEASSTRVAAKRIISSPYRSQISSFVTENLVADAPSVPPAFVDIDVRTLLCSSLASDGRAAAVRAVGGLTRGRLQ